MRINAFSVWNMTCNIFEKAAQREAAPPRPDLATD
jgi:hypothetical protein